MTSEYGHEGSPSTLVPEALTVYRHFGVDMRDGLLLHMSHDVRERERLDYVPGREVHEARCSRWSVQYGYADGLGPHTAPEGDCTCGFYAHYDPSDDFYGEMMWGPRMMTEAGQASVAHLGIVRAVVEVTGTTVMGRRGVRAQKLKIKALAVDWGKHVTRNKPDYGSYIRTASGLDLDPYESGAPYWREIIGFVYGTCRPIRLAASRGRPEGCEADHISDKVRDVALAYGARFYDSVADMVADHPRPDLSALGIEVEKGWTPGRYAPGGLAAWSITAQQAAYASASAYQQIIKPKSSIVRGGTVSLIYYDDVEEARAKTVHAEETVMEKALRLKRNRPAPPGTGIDRRRGKLR